MTSTSKSEVLVEAENLQNGESQRSLRWQRAGRKPVCELEAATSRSMFDLLAIAHDEQTGCLVCWSQSTTCRREDPS